MCSSPARWAWTRSDSYASSTVHAMLQFHGHESLHECARFGRPYLRAVPMADGIDLLDWERQYPSAAAMLADAPSAGFGGSGRTFDWSQLPALERRSRPLILA